MEIERKFTIRQLPENLVQYECRIIEQGYLCTAPVVRIRRDNDDYYLTYKGRGLMAREEYNLPLTKEGYEHMLPKADGNIIRKKRYMIPLAFPSYQEGYDPDPEKDQDLTIELDIFSSPTDLIMAEVEFASEAAANAFLPPSWFEKDVTTDPRYHNSNMI